MQNLKIKKENHYFLNFLDALVGFQSFGQQISSVGFSASWVSNRFNSTSSTIICF